ncbi:hypothetical protein M3A49_24320 [Paraburkholderia sp. CNPSo 3076]|uniref:hypothetical protein n=1 Tax=Paraburkholderia sp. CNPSo 3076 TaxID=2940936 RepID=UPI0022575CDD|nr:hypothetical protein [Paraburkholderia sp. CNPSo 3076]MCX5542586.1 hypothetical protein [Paraburkholderia sp. CNPSo 3076]
MRSIDILDTIRVTQSEDIDLVFMSFLVMLYVSHQEFFESYDQRGADHTLRRDLGQRVDHRITWPEIQERGPQYGNQLIEVPVFEWVLR